MSQSASKIVGFSHQKKAAKKNRSLSVDCRARGSYVPDKKRSSSEERKSGGNKLAVRYLLLCTLHTFTTYIVICNNYLFLKLFQYCTYACLNNLKTQNIHQNANVYCRILL